MITALVIAYIVIAIGAYFGISAVNEVPAPYPGAKFFAEAFLATFWPIALIARFFAKVYKQ